MKWNYIIPILSLFPLFKMAFDDYRKREIHILWLFLFATLVIAGCFLQKDCITVLSNMFYNTLVLSFLLTSIIIWLSIRKREFVNPFIEHLGGGDILFLMSITAAFNSRNYLIYIIASSMFSIIYWIIYNKLIKNQKNQNSTIPLVTMASITYVTYLIFNI